MADGESVEAPRGPRALQWLRAALRRRQVRVISTNVVAVALIVLGVLSGVQGYVLSEQNKALALCQQAYSNGFADALDARTQANTDAQAALDSVMQTFADVITTPDPTARARVQAVLVDYVTKRAEARKAQQEHPYPEAPRDACKHLDG